VGHLELDTLEFLDTCQDAERLVSDFRSDTITRDYG
jgi:hypothetical protein